MRNASARLPAARGAGRGDSATVGHCPRILKVNRVKLIRRYDTLVMTLLVRATQAKKMRPQGLRIQVSVARVAARQLLMVMCEPIRYYVGVSFVARRSLTLYTPCKQTYTLMCSADSVRAER